MKSASFEFKKKLSEGALLYPYAVITLSDGTSLTLDEYDFISSGNSISEGSSESKFPLGCAIAKTITISIDNSDDRYSSYDFYFARIRLSTRMQLDSGLYESVNEGYFTVINPETPGKTIVIDAVDDMYKADVSYTPSVAFPATLRSIANDVAAQSDLIVNPIFKNSDFVVNEAPSGLTCRSMFGLIAQIAGGNAVCNANGIITIKTYNASVFESAGIIDGGTNGEVVPNIIDGGLDGESVSDVIEAGTSVPADMHNLFNLSSQRIGTDDIVITGLSTIVEKDGEDEKDEETLVGIEGYTLKIENPLIKGNELKALNLIASLVVGLTLRPFTIDYVAYCIAEFMDPCYVWDADKNVYQSFITDIDFVYCDKTTIKNSSEGPLRNKSSYYSNATEAYRKAREGAAKQRGAWEKAIEDLSNRLNDATGLHTTIEKQTDGSFIFYLHDKETVEESQIIWKMTAEAWGVSTDGGNTWNGGMTVDGDTIVRILSAVGINADWINAGSIMADFIKGGKLTLGGANNIHGSISVLNRNNGASGTWNNSGITLEGTEADANITIINNKTWSSIAHGRMTVWDTSASSNKYIGMYNNAGKKCYFQSSDSYGAVLIETNFQSFKGQTHVENINCSGSASLSSSLSAFADSVSATKPMTILGNLMVFGKVTATQTRSAIATDSYGITEAYTYKTTSSMIGDIGEGITDSEGICYIAIDDVFSEISNTECSYQVFLQKEGRGDLWIESKEQGYFIVKGTPNIKFAWELKAKDVNSGFERLEPILSEVVTTGQLDYEHESQVMVEEYYNSKTEIDYEKESAKMVDEYYTSLEEVFNEENY